MFDRLIFDSGRFDRETNDKYEGQAHGAGELNTLAEMIYNIDIIIDDGASTLFALMAPHAIIESSGEIIEGNPGNPGSQAGNGGLELILIMERDVDFSGVGDIDIFNIGDIQTEIINLRGLSLLPNETITIDTDSMIVLFGLEHDVSSLSNESVFFNLNEGTNEIKFIIGYESVPSPIPANELETTIIWQNRWL